MSRAIDLVGQKFDMLTVVGRAKDRVQPNGKHIVMWKCICDCGNEYIARGEYLRSGITRHCGCNRKGNGFGKQSKLNEYTVFNEFAIGITTNTHNKFYVDIDDYENIKKYSWYENECGYLVSRINGKLVRMHRLIMCVTDNKLVVDHINHDTLDNRKENLRVVTRSQNNMNKTLQSNNKSGVTGVYFEQKTNKWVACIKINYQVIRLGQFEKFEDAVKSRKEAEEKYFGEYSYDNSNKKVV